MTKLQQICEYLESYAPQRLAEDWDNVGLLAGDRDSEVRRVMTCLTITPESANEAIAKNADLIVSHHPLPFRPIKQITADKTSTKLLWNLIRNGVSIYSPHTAFDSAANGINQTVCERVGLQDIRPLRTVPTDPEGLGSGRFGRLAEANSIPKFLVKLKSQFSIEKIRFVGKQDATISCVASACGSGGSFLESAVDWGCDAMITGEADFHSCLESAAQDVTLFLLGHYSSERFAIEILANALSEQFNMLEIWPSAQESDPIRWA